LLLASVENFQSNSTGSMLTGPEAWTRTYTAGCILLLTTILWVFASSVNLRSEASLISWLKPRADSPVG